ncbi:MAG: hypothetical protein JSW27_21260 [Phycisphaerales bacterium]|nr:MAG: hypothetical protein JSW27_21260 [Phycisphaerales bacterium]
MNEPSENAVVEAQRQEGPDLLEASLEVYPLRDASEDPGWAVKTVFVWLFIACGLYVFFLVLLVLGIWYD